MLVAIGRVASRQWGVIAVSQLRALGLTHAAIGRLVARGFLIRLRPGVYAVGYRRREVEARLQAALLLGGDGAALSHQAAAFWRGYTDRPPALIELRTPTRRRSRPGIRFHRTPGLKSEVIRGFPVTLPAATLVDYATGASHRRLRRAVAAACRDRSLDPGSLRESMRRGRAGSAALRSVLTTHLPAFESALSELETRFFELLQEAGVPIPDVNVTVAGMMVDCLFPAVRLVVELDGHEFHADPIASEQDRRREMRLRKLGYRVVRYTWRQVTETPDEVIADLRRELAAGA